MNEQMVPNLKKSSNLNWNFLEESMNLSSSVNFRRFALTNGTHQNSQIGRSRNLKRLKN